MGCEAHPIFSPDFLPNNGEILGRKRISRSYPRFLVCEALLARWVFLRKALPNNRRLPFGHPNWSRRSSLELEREILETLSSRRSEGVKPNWSRGIKGRLSLWISTNWISTSEGVKKKKKVRQSNKREREREDEEEAMVGPDLKTKGLVYGGNDTLFESTGLYGKSSVRKVALRTGKVETFQKIDDSIFGEGLTLFGERLFQVAWLQKTGFIYDCNNLSKVGEFMHGMNDGWGLATDGKVLFGSDGSSTLYQMDPHTFKILSKPVVSYKGHQVTYLNELEFVNGEVWANVLGVDCIARISPKDGRVTGWILLQNLREQEEAAGNQKQKVLNGIAWDSEKQRIFVTGKLWSKLYEIRVVPIQKPIDEGFIEQLCFTSQIYKPKK